jgi:hypothetical protein
MKTGYRHTEVRFPIAILLVALLFVAIGLVVRTHYGIEALVIYIIAAAYLTNYLSLTVEIKSDSVEMRFGGGGVRRSIALDEIHNLCLVETSVEDGLGIHLTGSGWLYNISRREAVEIILRDGSQVRIGSDEPEELARAIENALIGQKNRR